MGGLLLKDFYYVLQNKKLLLIVMIVCAFLLVTNGREGATFVISWVTLMFGIQAVSTFSYDETEHSIHFLLTLPVTRRHYVMEKYLFAICYSGAGYMAAMLICLVLWRNHTKELLVSSMAVALVMVFFLSVFWPIILKYGTEKSRLIMVVLIVACFVPLAAMDKMADNMFSDFLDEILHTLTRIPAGTALAGLVLLGICFIGISLFVSIRIMEKKEY